MGAKAGPINNARLKSFVERIEKLEEERKAIGGDIRDVISEAKGVGFDAKTIRWIVQERKIDAADRDERDALRDVYAHALGMAVHLVVNEGLSLREAGRATGVSKSSIHRALSVPASSQNPNASDAAGRIPGDEGEIDGHRNERHGEGCSPEGFQPERQSGSGGHQGDHRVADHQDGADSRPEQRIGGTRSSGGNHQRADGQHVVRPGGDEGAIATEPEVARAAPPVDLTPPSFLDQRKQVTAT